MFAALFSWSVGVLNLLPVPLLDGGQIVMAGFEMFAGKPSENTMRYAAWPEILHRYADFRRLRRDLIRIVG